MNTMVSVSENRPVEETPSSATTVAFIPNFIANLALLGDRGDVHNTEDGGSSAGLRWQPACVMGTEKPYTQETISEGLGCNTRRPGSPRWFADCARHRTRAVRNRENRWSNPPAR